MGLTGNDRTKHDPNMAVKCVAEVPHNQPKYDINQMIERIEMLLANPEAIRDDIDGVKMFCEQIVLYLAHVPLRKDIITMELEKLQHFLRKVSYHVPKQHADEIVEVCLKTLYKHMVSDEETSMYASVVLDLLDKKELIKQGVQWILQQNNDTKAIKNVFKTLMHWLTAQNQANDLVTWISEIITGLHELQKHDVLLDLSCSSVKSCFNYFQKHGYHASMCSILFHIMVTVEHSPDVFNMILPKAPTILAELGKLKEQNEPGDDCQQRFIVILTGLMIRFPNPDYQYRELKDCLKKYPRPTNFRHAFNGSEIPNSVIASANARVGLVNLGNTCYMNSVLQALVMTKQFSREILLAKIDAPLFDQIQKLLALLIHSHRQELNPRALLAAARPPDFVPGYQQDSSEFLGYLLEKLHEQEKQLIREKCVEKQRQNKNQWTVSTEPQSQLVKLPSECSNTTTREQGSTDSETPANAQDATLNEIQLPPTLIQRTFDGKLFVTYQCGVCDSKSTNLDAIRSFELSFPESNGIKTEYSVQKLLDFYCSSEKLIGDNQYYCDKCKQLCDGERSIKITKSPRNLILTLKHFRYDLHRHTRAKLMNQVLHDETISLWVTPEEGHPFTVQYSLYAAVVHAGTSMDSGHYYTYAQDEPDRWYKFNDNYVTGCTVDELHALSSPNTPYILFYQMSAPSTDCTMSLCIDEEMEHSASANLALVSTDSVPECQLPRLDELSPRLRDLVHDHNQSYKEETRTTTQKRFEVLPRNRDTDDDPPPNSCGSNAINFNSRFIF
ncbi:ubiquitin carboxyl-terminal hydrolase 38 isoform X2 [Aedes albopictus]|uniref:USP domain-containing protein n=1 Tax=Aedes albopictus TaxID=7160 RepID=A0ABM1XQE8_AEDAL|nr:ubiquitin carboxyl-terminal hydrolase 38 isoform X2 [Aedes albopictus]